MYFSVIVGGSSHLWRQRFPDGTPEQLTYGPTEEEGVTVAPDGRSLVTSLGTRRSAIWMRDAAGERAITSEGFARRPRLSRDGTRVFYLLQQDSSSPSAELRSVDLRSGKTETVLPGVSVSDYDLSRDEKEIVYTTKEGNKDSRIWLAALDRRTPPRQIATAGDQVSFGAEGDIFFRLFEQSTNTLVRIKQDGSGSHQVGTVSIVNKYAVSPDGEWVIVHSANANEGAATLAVPVDGGPPRRICIQNCPAAWSSDGRFLYVARGASATAPARTLALPVPAGKTFPDLPAPGIDLAASHVSVPGGIVIDVDSVSPGPDPATYVFTKSELVRNLFRIPLR